MHKIILASGSPRRKEILTQVGISFEVMVSEEEEVITSNDPIAVVKELALIKAGSVAQRVFEAAVIIGADTVVAHNNRILGKPKDEEDAHCMLNDLQNSIHDVYTGVALILKTPLEKDKIINFVVRTKVGITAMSSQQIDAYIASKESLDKAGAYAIQGRFAIYVDKLEGDFYNAMGFPIAAIYKKLTELGVLL